MKGVIVQDGWEKAAMVSLLRWEYLNQWAIKRFAWFRPTCPGTVIRRSQPSVN